jgi:type I restriction enzyme S subunit
LNLKDVAELPIILPPSDERDRIIENIRSIDDKIELNRKMNETLEAMARALFKSWFVDFDPVRAKAEGHPTGLPDHIAALFPGSFEDSELGEIPQGWHIGQIGEVAALHKTAISPSAEPSTEFAHYSIPAYDEARVPKLETGSEIKSNKFTVPENAVLLSKLNPAIPRVWLVDTRALERPICSTEFLVMLPRAEWREFLYTLFTSESFRRELSGLATGTSNSHQRVRPEGLNGIRIVIPPAGLVAQFSRECKPMMERATCAIWESVSLADLRNSLLPKLISGELRVQCAALPLGATV